MSSPLLTLGSIHKCAFPFDVAPAQPGPFHHYCLYVSHFTMANGSVYVACIYGTSQLDPALLKHHAGKIMSVDVKQHVQVNQGTLSGSSIHFVYDHVAVMPYTADWFHQAFHARLKHRDIHASEVRHREHAERLAVAIQVGEQQAIRCLQHTMETGYFGLQPGKTLR